jgi:hypothetical protein
VLPLGPATITCSAVDAHGNHATGSATVTVVDTTAPAVRIDVPGPVEATSAEGARVAYSARAPDAVAGGPAVACDRPAGTFPLGETTLTCTAVDGSGNRGTQTATVAVVDTTKPRISIEARETWEARGPDGAQVTYGASATDLVAGPVGVSCTPASGATFAVGQTTVTCTASDGRGNTAGESVTITVVDRDAPVLHLPSGLVLYYDHDDSEGVYSARLDYAVRATDAVDPSPSVRCTPSAGSLYTFEWRPDPTVTVACTATDRSGNSRSGSFTIALEEPPSEG